MNGADRRDIASIFADVADLPPDERLLAIDNACGNDAALRQELLALVEANDQATAFFDDLESILPVSPMATAMNDDEIIDPYGLVGRTLSHYQIEECLGGGMAVVYRAHDSRLPRDVALKLLPPEALRDESAVARFRHEAYAASSLNHPNISVVYDVGRLKEGPLFVAMAYYDGETLKKKVSRGPLPISSVIMYGIGITEGLAEAHRHGIIHRDIKPANVMVTSGGHVRLLDFGVAKATGQSTLTKTGGVVGTLAYMAPEQVRGEDIDRRVDVWSTGLVLYEMLAGKHPFFGSHSDITIFKILNEPPPALGELCPDAPEELCRLIHRCLNKDPAERPQSIEEVAESLRDIVRPAPAPLPPTRREQFAAWFSGLRWWVKSAGTVTAAVLLVLAAWRIRECAQTPVPVDLAVLPFVNVGADSLLVDGLFHTVNSSLARLEGRQSTVYLVPPDDILYKNVRSSDDALRTFGVDLVLSPKAQDAADEILVYIDLVDAENGRLVDSRLSRVQYSDLSSMQEVVINSLTELLKPYVRVDVREDMRVGRTAISSAYEKYTRARGYLNNGEVESNIDAAINLLKAAASEDDQYALVYAGLCEAYLQKYTTTRDTSFITESISNGVKARDLDPTLAPARLALGRTYLERGDYDHAESELTQAYSLMPHSAAVQYNLARVYEGKDEVDRAERYYREAIRLKPDYWRYHNGIGIFYHYEGRHEEARAAFLRVIELRPDNPWGYNNLGAQHLELGQREEALAQFLRAREVNPRVTEAIGYANDNMARVFYAERDFETAAGLFEEAVDIQDLSYDSWDQLGNAYFKLDRIDDARSAWERVVELVGARLAVNPNDRNALNYVSEAYAKLGRRRPAFSNLYHLLSLDRVRPTDYVVAAKVHDILGQRDSALHYVEVAFKSGAEVGDVERSIWLDELRADARYTNAVALESQDE